MKLLAERYAAERRNARRARRGYLGQVAVTIDGKYGDRRIATGAIDHREPLAIGGDRDICRRSRLALSSGGLLAVFAVSFRDDHTDHFFLAGVICLLTGLLHAILAGLLSWLMLRRGFAVNPASAGLVAGTLGGLAGVGMLELHCPNFQTAHILVWHTAVLPVGATVGALLAKRIRLQVK